MQKNDLPAIGAPLDGGLYAGLTLHDNAPMALVLLPGEKLNSGWEATTAWATEQGGELPSRIDQLVLLQNLKAEFKPDWYWSAESLAGDAAYAWGQYFTYGGQTSDHKGYEGHARAVRRLPIELFKEAAAAIEELARDAWISVKDRLPGALSERSILCAGRDPDGNWWKEIVSAEWLRDSAPADFATHWMPLPPPPAAIDAARAKDQK